MALMEGDGEKPRIVRCCHMSIAGIEPIRKDLVLVMNGETTAVVAMRTYTAL